MGASWLGRIYGLGDEGLYVPGNSPEVSDGIAAIDAISRPRNKRRRLRLTAAENKAIEQRAVEVTRAYFDGLEYETKDGGSTESYDIKASKDGQRSRSRSRGQPRTAQM